MKIEIIKTGYLQENCYLLTIKDECLLIDPGSCFDKIKKKIGNKKLLAVLVTHYHFDHVESLMDVVNFYKPIIIDYKSSKSQRIGSFVFEIIDTKGHKDDAVTYYFRSENAMFVGDFIFKGSIGRCDLEGGDFNMMKKSIDKIKKYSVETKIYPGHGNSTSLSYELANNPYMKGKLLNE